MTRPEILVFDVNETLLDLAGLRPAFRAALGSDASLGEWFARMLHGSLVANHLDRHRPFGEIGVEALRALASKQGLELSASRAQGVVEGMRRLDPHPDVVDALGALRSAGFRLATLTNGSPETAEAQLEHAGLTDLLDHRLTVSIAGRFKPAAEPYHAAAERCGVSAGEAMMVAAHDWDVAGAARAGFRSAFVRRPSAVWSLPDPPPDLDVPDLHALVEALS